MKESGIVFKIVRWPFLICVGFIVLIELWLYITIRWVVVAYEYSFTWRKKLKGLRKEIQLADNYKIWREVSERMDQLQGKKKWRESLDVDKPLYDQQLIFSVLKQLKDHSQEVAETHFGPSYFSILKKLMTTLEAACKSNLGGIENERLYAHTYVGTKEVVEQFYVEVEKCLYQICNSPLSVKEKLQFFKKINKEYGQTALCLSGGATFGYYHLGVIQCLFQRGLLPKVITGTSAGSMIAALICVRKDEELYDLIKPELASNLSSHDDSHFKLFLRFLRKGFVFDSKQWVEKIQWVTKGTTTFLEAYKQTGRILNITAVPQERNSPPKLLNYLNAPNVVIYSAVIASAAVPGLIEPVELLFKTEDGNLHPYHQVGAKWCDGSLKTDIPLSTLHSLFNVNYTIVSQVNPHIFPFFFHNRGSGGSPSPHRQGRGWRGGFILSTFERYLKLDLVKWLRFLRDLDLLPPVLGQDWSFVFLQKFEGTVTITPKINLRDYFRIITDPDEKELKRFILHGQKMTWPKLSMIENRMKIEKSIQECKRCILQKPK